MGEQIVPYAFGSGGAKRFAGWFQPWTLALIFATPVAWALLERRRDIVQLLRARDWRRRVGSDDKRE